jgi:FlgN protein
MLAQSLGVTECVENSVNEELFTSLIDVLMKELLIYFELKEFIIQEKYRLTRSPSIAQINENNIIKENIILKSRILEEVRSSVLKKIARNFNVDENEVKLTSLVEYAPEEKRKIVEQIKNDLLNVVKDITSLNNENEYLIEQFNNNVNGSLEFLSFLICQSSIYLNNGKFDEIRSNGRFLQTEG